MFGGNSEHLINKQSTKAFNFLTGLSRFETYLEASIINSSILTRLKYLREKSISTLFHFKYTPRVFLRRKISKTSLLVD